MSSVEGGRRRKHGRVVWAGEHLWPSVAVGLFAVITPVAIWWILQHPFGTNWDEANYINQAIRDRSALYQGPWELLKAILRRDASRPPAYRILVLPVTALLGASPMVLRLFSWGTFGGTLWLMYLTGERLRDSATGGFVVCFLLGCPILIGPNMRFYVDYSLYLSIAGTLYCLFCQWDHPKSRSWIGLGLCLGLGAMAKPTIAFIVGPMLVLVMLLRLLKWIAAPSLATLFKSYGLAGLIMAPWWVLNGKAALTKAVSSGGNIRDALGHQGELGTLLKWCHVFVQSITGPMLGVLAGAIAISYCLNTFLRYRAQLSRSQSLALIVCLTGVLPLAWIAAFGVNHNPRLIAPLLLPLGLALGLMASAQGWLTYKPIAAVALVLMVAQVSVMVTPHGSGDRYQEGDTFAQSHNWGNSTSVMRLEEQWDWTPLYQLAQQRQLENPKIGYLGSAKTLNPPQLLLPWVMAGKTANVAQLWNFKAGPVDWDALLKRASTKDIVVTFSPEDAAPSDLAAVIENQHNIEFSERISQTDDFMPLTSIPMGKFSPTDVHIFIHKIRETKAQYS